MGLTISKPSLKNKKKYIQKQLDLQISQPLKNEKFILRQIITLTKQQSDINRQSQNSKKFEQKNQSRLRLQSYKQKENKNEFYFKSIQQNEKKLKEQQLQKQFLKNKKYNMVYFQQKENQKQIEQGKRITLKIMNQTFQWNKKNLLLQKNNQVRLQSRRKLMRQVIDGKRKTMNDPFFQCRQGQIQTLFGLNPIKLCSRHIKPIYD